ncbi:MAG: DUF99 family protein [Methanomicrobiaceae archaeon]|nr:DUF99 family protein [Methanomicrobiaceae archaeon]
MHLAKKGIRVCGIAESFSGRERSTLAGVVIRKDLVIDGAAFARVTVGGTDATSAVLEIFRTLDREDIACLMVSGCVIAWFNIIDPTAILDATDLPLIVVTYEESEGLAGDIARHFPGDAERLAAYRRLGERVPVDLGTGYRIFIRAWGIEREDAARICDAFTLEGRIPEPVRIARIIARAAMRLEEGY